MLTLMVVTALAAPLDAVADWVGPWEDPTTGSTLSVEANGDFTFVAQQRCRQIGTLVAREGGVVFASRVPGRGTANGVTVPPCAERYGAYTPAFPPLNTASVLLFRSSEHVIAVFPRPGRGDLVIPLYREGADPQAMLDDLTGPLAGAWVARIGDPAGRATSYGELVVDGGAFTYLSTTGCVARGGIVETATGLAFRHRGDDCGLGTERRGVQLSAGSYDFDGTVSAAPLRLVRTDAF